MNREPETGAEAPLTEAELRRDLSQAWAEMTDSVLQCLEERYGRRFSICKVFYDLGIARLRMTVRTQDEPFVCFTAEQSVDSEKLRDGYAGALCLNELKAALEKDLPGAVVSAALWEGPVSESAVVGLSLAEYLLRHGDRRVAAHIIVPEDACPEREAVLSAVQRACEAFGADIAARCTVLDGEGVEACRLQLDSSPSLTEAAVRKYKPARSFAFLVEGGAVRASEVN